LATARPQLISPATLALLEAYAFRYDSSLMADDFQPYRPHIGDYVSAQEPPGSDSLTIILKPWVYIYERAGDKRRGELVAFPGSLGIEPSAMRNITHAGAEMESTSSTQVQRLPIVRWCLADLHLFLTYLL